MAQQAKPTKADVFSWLEQRRMVFADMHRRMDVADEWLHADEEPSPVVKYLNRGFPADHQWAIFPYAWAVLNRGVNQIHTAEVPQVTYELPSQYKKRYKQAADKEKRIQEWMQGVLYSIVTRSTENPLLDLLQQQLGLGLGCLYYPLDYQQWGTPPDHGRGTPAEEEAWEAFERKRSETLPWRVTSLHPTWVFFDPGHDPPVDFIIERPVSLQDMARDFPALGLDPASTGGGGTIPAALYVEYVSAEWYGCWVNGIPVTQRASADADSGATPDDDGIAENTLGYPWSQLAWSGLGKKDRWGQWARRGVGMIQRGIGEFRSLTFDDNFLTLVKRSFIPKYVAQGPTQEQAAEETADIDPLSGAVASLSRDVSFGPMPAPEVPDAIMQDMRERQQRLEQLYGPGLLSGEYHSEPASKQAARLEQARAPYRAPKKNAEQAVATMLSHFLWCLKYEPDLGDGVGVSWQEGKGAGQKQYSAWLKPDDVVLGGKLTVDFSPMTPQDKAFQVQDAKEKQDNGWYSAETAMKKGGEVEDTVEELAQIQADLVMRSPEYIGFLTQTAIALLQQRFQPPAPPPAPAPAAPGAPGPEMGMMSNGMNGAMPGEPALSPPGVPQQPGPPLGSGQEAMQQMRSAFVPPPPVRAVGY